MKSRTNDDIDLDERDVYTVTEADVEKVRSQLQREGKNHWSYKGKSYSASSERNINEIIQRHLVEIALWEALSRKIREPEEIILDQEAEAACLGTTGMTMQDYLNSELGMSGYTKQFYDIAQYVIARDKKKAETAS